MKYVTLLGLALFMLMSLVIGVRLMWRYARTRQLPELFMGMALLCCGFFAFAMGTAGKLLIDGTPMLRSVLSLLGMGFEYSGDAAMVLFAWRVFQAQKRWARAVVMAFGLAVVGVVLGEVGTGQYLRYADALHIDGPWVPLALAVRGFAPTWLAFECFRFHAQLRKRMRIGLAEPLVVQRVALWGIAMAASAGAYVMSITHRLIYGSGLRDHAWALNFVSALALVAAISLGLAFFPPRAYRDRLARTRTRQDEDGQEDGDGDDAAA